MSHMLVAYNLKPNQTQAEFEQWLHQVDIPGYKKMSSMKNPTYFRVEGLLGEDGNAPYQYIVTIEMAASDAIENEIGDPSWAGFVEDFESRTQNAVYMTDSKIFP